MASFTTVGTSYLSLANQTYSQFVSFPLPTGTAIGDLVFVGHRDGLFVTDPRFTTIPYFSSSTGAFGYATDLSDIDIAVAPFLMGLAAAIAMTDVIGTPYGGMWFIYPSETLVLPESAGVEAAAATVFDQSVLNFYDIGAGDSADWENFAEVGRNYAGGGLNFREEVRPYALSGVSPLPALDVTYGPDNGHRIVTAVILADDAAAARPRLRQRQTTWSG